MLNTDVEQEVEVSSAVTVPTDSGDARVLVLQVKVATLLRLFEGNRSEMGRYFGVSRAQPGRWLSGADRPAPEVVRRIEDLSWIWDRLTAETSEDVARDWLRAHNAFLDTTPLDALEYASAGQVVGAWDAEQAGSYA